MASGDKGSALINKITKDMKGSLGLHFVRVVKYWNKLPASVVAAPSVKIFKKRLEKVLAEVFPHLLH